MTPELATRLAELKSQLDGVDDSAATLVLKSDLAALVAEVEKGQAAIEFVRTYAREEGWPACRGRAPSPGSGQPME